MTVAPTATLPRDGRSPLAVAAGLGATCVALTVWNPGDDGTPICPTRILTGLDCPLCGGLRAVASLGRLDVVTALDHNVLVVALVPVAIVAWVMWWLADRRGEPRPRVRLPRVAWVGLLALAVTFTVVRNLDTGPVSHWLASGRS